MKKFYYLVAGIGVMLVTIIACEKSAIGVDEFQTLQKEGNFLSKSPNAQRVTKKTSNSLIVYDERVMGNDFVGTWSLLGKVHGQLTLLNEHWDDDITLTMIYSDVTIAANGDEVYSTSTTIMTFTSDYLGGTYVGEVEITGGTGRFEGATGFLDTTGVYDGIKGESAHHAVGEITY
ncbi:MAG: hypothetical protein Q7U59_07210 [Lutibacter sp.]|nr:hypothetical protein [Lutibacter sp.]